MNADDQKRMNDRLVNLLQHMCWLPQNQQLAMLYGMIGAMAALADDVLWAIVIDAASQETSPAIAHRTGELS